MTDKDLIKYIDVLGNNPDTDLEILREIPNIKLILTAYSLGLEEKELNVNLLLTDLSLEKAIPPQFHELVGMLACIKSDNTSQSILGYLINDTSKRLKDFKNYYKLHPNPIK